MVGINVRHIEQNKEISTIFYYTNLNQKKLKAYKTINCYITDNKTKLGDRSTTLSQQIRMLVLLAHL